MYTPIPIDREKLPLMGVPFPDLATLIHDTERTAVHSLANVMHGYGHNKLKGKGNDRNH